MSLSNFKVLTFDVVGTLIDFERGMLDYLRRAVPDATVSDDDFLAAYRNARASANCGAFPDDLERVWNEVAVAVGLPDTPELARGLRDSVAQWPAAPGATYSAIVGAAGLSCEHALPFPDTRHRP